MLSFVQIKHISNIHSVARAPTTLQVYYRIAALVHHRRHGCGLKLGQLRSQLQHDIRVHLCQVVVLAWIGCHVEETKVVVASAFRLVEL